MSLIQWVRAARERGASDLHLEPGRSPILRVEGHLRPLGESVPGALLMEEVRGLVGADWREFTERRSWDGSKVLAGAQCRLHAFTTSRGAALSVRLLSGVRPTLDSLNLHPDLGNLVRGTSGLVLVCGPTGSGKSSTLAALVHAVDQGQPRHVITVEQPVEYRLTSQRSLVRQREVGRDTPSFEAGLLDALREDPDVILVGEMRRVRTMQLTLDAAETGHLVLATLHASSPAEAVQRLVAAFAPETQSSVRSQVAGCLVGVLCQRLVHRQAAGRQVPECELLLATNPVRHHIREAQWHKLTTDLELGAPEGMWTRERYLRWLEGRTRWSQPAAGPAEPEVVEAMLVDPPLVEQPARAEPSASQASRPEPEEVDLDEVESVDELLAAMREMS